MGKAIQSPNINSANIGDGIKAIINGIQYEGVVVNVYTNTVTAELFEKSVRADLEIETNRVVLRHDEYTIFHHENNPEQSTYLNRTWNYSWKRKTS